MKKLSYKKAGVDIEAAQKAIKLIKPLVKKTYSKKVFGDLGNFAGFFEIDKNNVLVASTDGVGSKLKIAFELNEHNTIGIDLVAMSVNDTITSGAKPLFFLDYIGTNKVKPQIIKEIIKGITKGCQEAGCSLIGGEIAELPDFYKKGEYDLAGFGVGIVKKNKIIDGQKIKAGDLIIGLASDGLHSNGYALARRALKKANKNTLKELLKPTKIYAKTILDLTSKFDIKGIAHITGGGLTGNIPRILPKNCQAEIYKNSWPVPKIFKEIQEKGKISDQEMFKTFNMGIGMVFIISKNDPEKINSYLKAKKEKFFLIGKIV